MSRSSHCASVSMRGPISMVRKRGESTSDKVRVVVFPAMLAGTIVAENYLAQADVLGTTFLEHHPDGEFVTLVIDAAEEHRPSMRMPGRVVLPDDLGLAAGEWEQMAGIYDVMELATAVKPAFLRHLLTQTSAASGNPAVCYLDPDVEVYHPFPEVAALADEVGIVLTPHVLHPLPATGICPTNGR